MKSSNQLKIVLWLTRTMCIASLLFCELTILTTVSQAASFECKKANTKTEHMICDSSSPFGFIETQDEELDIAYQWALMRVNDKQKLIKEQRLWLKDIRNNCSDRECLAKVYRERLDRLATLVQTSGCYTLQPIKDNGNVRQIEPVCKVMEKNLNQFCDQPPMACGLKIAPEFRGKITLPNWIPLNPEANRGLIEEFIRAPWQNAWSLEDADGKEWQKERPEIELALAKKRLLFSTAQLDLYNLGKPQTVYRLDYGDCQIINRYLSDREQWDKVIQPSSVKTQYAPDTVRALFRQYFSVQKEALRDILVFNGKTYDYLMRGTKPSLEEFAPENVFVINRHEQRYHSTAKNPFHIDFDNICLFNYQPTGESK
jgi:uncharacterized protein